VALAPCSALPDDSQQAKKGAENRLARETSPYLLLHAHNPIDWYPWGPEAFARAKAEDKPVFLSVGYSSCYWCHVMERESFVDAEIARMLNEGFVSIKVDREERPDVDQIYMTALQAFRPGGWPMSLFLTPDGRPFFAGSYFPPRDREGAPGFVTVITEVRKAWSAQRKAVEKTADAVTDAVRSRLKAAAAPPQALDAAWAAAAVKELVQQFDPEYGGFGFDPANPRRPKFPQAVDLLFLLDQERRRRRPDAEGDRVVPLAPQADDAAKAGGDSPPAATTPLAMVLLSLDRMARGGIRDHLDGGYHRYSTDRFWRVPHFEKMLYDNALLASVHLVAYELTHDARWRNEAEAIFGFIDRRMTSPEAAFYSALDAETDHEEGAFYLWTSEQVRAALAGTPASDIEAFLKLYGFGEKPQFEPDRHVLFEPTTRSETAAALGTTQDQLELRLAPLRERLLAVRTKRRTPLCDDKIITGWNGLMIAAYADAYRILKAAKYRQAAEAAARFLLSKLRASDGRLLRTYRQGKAKLPAYQEDYAYLAHGLLRLHAATQDARWLSEAKALADRMIADFEDRAQGGFFFTSEGHETLLARAKEPFDAALPSGNSMAIIDLIAVYRATGEAGYLSHAEKALSAFSAMLSRAPAALPTTVVAMIEFLEARPAPISLRLPNPGTLPEPSQRAVTAAARVTDASASGLTPGSEIDVIVTVTIQDGWHIYANRAGLPEMRPTTLRLERDNSGTISLERVSYPAGQVKALGPSGVDKVALYEGTVQISSRLRIARNAAPGATQLSFVLSHQACNDRYCLAPAELKVPLRITIARPGSSPGQPKP
jgi:uncharacterized protein YyaL (SSP411 family)